MEDIAPDLLKKIQADFQSSFDKSTVISELYEKVRDGTATYLEANKFAIETGDILAEAYKNNLSSAVLPDGKMYYNIAQRIIEPTMENNYSLITEVTNQVQKSLNEAAGIGIKPITPELNRDRIDGIVNKVSNSENFDDVAWVLEEPIVNFSQSIVSDAIKANAEFHYDSGLKPTITRKLAGGCCKWCRALAGIYNYPDVPKDVYRRHDYCRCRVDYVTESGRENVHNNNFGKKRRYVQDKYGNYVKAEYTRIEHAKKMAATEKERKAAARQKRIKTWAEKKNAKNSSVKKQTIGLTRESIENSIFVTHKSVGAMAKKFYVKKPYTLKDSGLYIKEGTEVTGIKVIAEGSQIREVQRLIDAYPKTNGEKTVVKDWYKVRGRAIITDDKGYEESREIHWYQAENIGKVEFKFPSNKKQR